MPRNTIEDTFIIVFNRLFERYHVFLLFIPEKRRVTRGIMIKKYNYIKRNTLMETKKKIHMCRTFIFDYV